jgi:DNA-binding NtrC family response regulator
MADQDRAAGPALQDADASRPKWLRAFQLTPAFQARMARFRSSRTSRSLPMVRETPTVNPFGAGAESAEWLSRVAHCSPQDEMVGPAIAAAGIGVTVHGPDGSLLLSNSIASALCPDATPGVDLQFELLRADGMPLQLDDRPVQLAIATRQPVWRATVGSRQPGGGALVWLHVDAIPCLDRHSGDLVRVVCLWTVASTNPAEDSSSLPAHVDQQSVARERFPEIDGTSAEIEQLKHHMMLVARDPDVTVLILGESGTGKERVASAIHRASRRCRAPFVVVNCAGFSPTLVEDEIFGHVRGAFTGAVDDQPGPFERADGGTVFLDEIGELTPDLQIKLLRALQQRTVQRLGSRRETPFDVRVIAATHVDLARAKARGRFREDLYYRLKVYELRVPPLRRRGAADIQMLIETTLRRFAARKQKPVPALDPAVAEIFERCAWAGNIRELENTLERMIVAAGTDPWLRREHLPEHFGVPGGRDCHVIAPGATSADLPRTRPSAPEVRAALERNGFRYDRTAADLGLSRHQLYRLLKCYELPPTRGSE